MKTAHLENSLNEKIKPKKESTSETKNSPEIIKASPVDIDETTEKQEKDFGERLDDLKAAISEMNQHGDQITEEMFENIMNMPFSEFESYTNGGKNISDPDLKNFHNQVSGIINGELNESYKGNRFRQIMNKPISRALFAAVCLFLKFGVPAEAQENNEANIKDAPTNKIELKAPNNFDGDPNNKNINYSEHQADYESFPHQGLKEASTMNITQSFEVDKANISETDANLIKSQAENFLNKINPNNFEQYKNAKKVIYVSSDERATKYGADNKKLAPTLENNINLSNDRFIEGEKVIQDAFANNDYSKSGLTPEQIKEIKETKFELSMPDKGYTKIIELNKINPQTGEKYTEADITEIKKNDPNLYKALNDECRYVKLDLMVESTIQKVSQCDRVLFFIDNSPSTEHTMDDMANKLEELGIQENSKGNIAKADLVYYTNDASPVKNLPDILAAAKDLRNVQTKGSSIENPFKSSISYFKSLIENDAKLASNGNEVEDYRAAIYTTDEGLQDVQNIFEAAKLATEAHVKDANIFLYSGQNNEPLEKNLFELRNEIEQIIKAKMELNLLTLEQNKQDEEKNLHNLMSQANEKVSAKTLQESFGQDKLNNEDTGLKTLIAQNQTKYIQNIKSPQEKAIIYQLFKSINNLEKVNKLFSAAQTQTFEDYLANTQIEIKTFTEEKGKKIDFNVLGYEKLASNITRTSIQL